MESVTIRKRSGTKSTLETNNGFDRMFLRSHQSVNAAGAKRCEQALLPAGGCGGTPSAGSSQDRVSPELRPRPSLTGERTATLSASVGLLGLSMRGARAPIQSQCDQAPSWRPPPHMRRGAERRPNERHRQGARQRRPTAQGVVLKLALRIFDEGCWLACQVCRRRPPRGGNERDSCELSDENANTWAHQGCVCWLHVERSLR